MTERWRLLELKSADGPENMAVDEAMFVEMATGKSPPTLRIYDWVAPCLSIGNAQRVADVDLSACHAEGVPVLRRASGGTAVLHEQQAAFSLVLPSDHPLACPDIIESYRRISVPLLSAARALGLECRAALPEEARPSGQPNGLGSSVCLAAFAPYELLFEGKKIVGNAQVRRRGAVLHHGVFPLDFVGSRTAGFLAVHGVEERVRLAQYLDERVGSLRWGLGRTVAAADLQASLCRGFVEALGVVLEPGELSRAERDRASELMVTRYANPEWTFRS